MSKFTREGDTVARGGGEGGGRGRRVRGKRRELERVLVLSLCTRRCRCHRKGSRMLLLGLSRRLLTRGNSVEPPGI